MGPVRKEKSSKKSRLTRPSHPQKDDVVGVQKIKSALRQARRFLAKENLPADKRVETERRVKALEADLHRAQLARKEKSLSVRYHKVKFFERQKVVRKIFQAKKALVDSLKDVDIASKTRKKLDRNLAELRVDLNYILHYPKMKKYISLFPPEVRNSSEASHELAESAKTGAEREQTRDWIRSLMANGDLPAEPEVQLASHERRAEPIHAEKPSVSKRSKRPEIAYAAGKRKTVVDDDFFEEGSGEERSASGSGSGRSDDGESEGESSSDMDSG